MTIQIQIGSTKNGIIVARDEAGDIIGGTIIHDLSDDSVAVVLDKELDGLIEALQKIKLHVESRK